MYAGWDSSGLYGLNAAERGVLSVFVDGNEQDQLGQCCAGAAYLWAVMTRPALFMHI